MKWRRGVGGNQIEDRRGAGGFGSGGRSGMSFPLPMGRAGGVGGIGIIIALVVVVLQSGILGGGGGGDGGGATGLRPTGAPDPDAELADFVAFVVDDVQSEWTSILPEQTVQDYGATTLVLFDGGVQTGCGAADSSVGPFYCPLDSKVYLDLGFFRELHDRFGAPGDFAQAYVIAHEFGHHVQNLLGTNARVRDEQQSRPDEANELSVRLELQADCLAGVWAFTAYEDELLEAGDIEEGIAAAESVGDDRIQSQAGVEVSPETWTHGSSQQRVQWFRTGFESGVVEICDTFS
ncbi:hypothetical protein BH18ACT4_BH18ACT4_12590 [soil metagenome]